MTTLRRFCIEDNCTPMEQWDLISLIGQAKQSITVPGNTAISYQFKIDLTIPEGYQYVAQRAIHVFGFGDNVLISISRWGIDSDGKYMVEARFFNTTSKSATETITCSINTEWAKVIEV